MNNNVKMVQSQIKSFNKALSRAKAKGSTSDVLDNINDLIDYDRMTHKMFAKAGKGYLESLTPEELLAYSADIEYARELIDVGNWAYKLDIEGAKDPITLMWKMFDELKAKGLGFDSDQVKAVEKGDVNISWKEMAGVMYKYLNDPDFLLEDVDNWWNKQTGLEE